MAVVLRFLLGVRLFPGKVPRTKPTTGSSKPVVFLSGCNQITGNPVVFLINKDF